MQRNTHTHTHPFNDPFSGTTRVSRYQKGKTNLDFTEARDSEWQWHQLGHMQVCTSLQTNNHASTPPLIFYRPDALPATQPCQSTEGKHAKKHKCKKSVKTSRQNKFTSNYFRQTSKCCGISNLCKTWQGVLHLKDINFLT